LGRLERYQEAVASYDKALDIDPKLASAWYDRCQALAKLGRHQEALSAIERYLQLEPKDADGWHSKGTAFFKLRRYQKALASYDTASSLKPAEPLYHYNCAVTLHRMRKGKEAKERLRRILELDPGFSPARMALERVEEGHPVLWWEWWFGESWPKRSAGGILVLLLAVYLVLPLFEQGSVLPGPLSRLALNVGQRWEYYIVPVAAIILLLVLPNLHRLSGAGVELEAMPPKKAEPRMEPLERLPIVEEAEPGQPPPKELS